MKIEGSRYKLFIIGVLLVVALVFVVQALNVESQGEMSVDELKVNSISVGCEDVETDPVTGKLTCGTDEGITEESDPKIATLGNNKWCKSNSDGTLVNCDQDAPSGGSFSGTPYAFSVHRNNVAMASVPSNTLIDFTTKSFDINNEFNLNSDKFYPGVSGKYLLVGSIYVNNFPNGKTFYPVIYRNGVRLAHGVHIYTGSGGTGFHDTSQISVIVDAQQGDYFELKVATDASSVTVSGLPDGTSFSGSLLGGPAGESLWAQGSGNDINRLYGNVAIGSSNSDPAYKLHVNGALFANSAKINQENWIAPTLLSGWQNYVSGGGADFTFNPAGYMKDSLGFVHLRGAIKIQATCTPQGTSYVFNLPEGYRPQYRNTFLTVSNWGNTRIDVAPSGIVTLHDRCDPSHVSLDGITFKAYS